MYKKDSKTESSHEESLTKKLRHTTTPKIFLNSATQNRGQANYLTRKI